MTRSTLLLAAAAIWMAAGQATSTLAADPWGGHHATPPVVMNPWHGAYFYPGYNQPLAVVIPPTAGMSTEWGWGMSATRVTANWHQFQRPFPGVTGVSGGFAAPPRWPSDTTQFGAYYIRGPW